MNEHENEPIPGLPAHLPEGETILWQGAPCWKSLARRAFHVGQIGVYFVVLLAWSISAAHADGTPVIDAVLSALRVLPLAFVAVIILGVLAWLTSRTTLYTITNRRIVIRFGGGGGRLHGSARFRHANCRLRDSTVVLLRRRRLQAEFWPH